MPCRVGETADTNMDPEKQLPDNGTEEEEQEVKTNPIKGLGWLDRLLALWILLAMIIGILLGNFVPETGPALQKGKFVGVSIPIGTQRLPTFSMQFADQTCSLYSHRFAHHDVPNLVQSQV